MTALVTGGGTGVGRAIALALAEQMPVVVMGRRAGPLEQTAALAPDRITTLVADVTDPHALDGVGPIDVLMNNAGTSGGVTWLASGDASAWASVLATNVLGAAYCCAAVVPGMVARGRGYVLNVNSLQGSRSFPGCASYGASKAALMRLTDALAAEVDGTGVVVLDVSPGLVRTDMTDALGDLLDGVTDDEWTPVERVAATVRALVSGRYDALHGRFVHAEDDLDDLLARLGTADPDARRLRLRPAGGDDPLFA